MGPRGLQRPSPGLMARLGVSVGGRVRKPRAVEDPSGPTPENERAWRDHFRNVVAWDKSASRRARSLAGEKVARSTE